MATLDTLLFVPEQSLVDDSVIPVREVVHCPGGKGIVTAAAIREAGGAVLPCALVGAESRFTRLIEGELDPRFVLELLPTDNRTWISVSSGQKVVTFVARGTMQPPDTAKALAAVEDFAGEVDALYLTVEDPLLLRAALRVAMARRIPIALNASIALLEAVLPTDRELLANLLAASSIVFCNDRESSRVLNALEVGNWAETPGPRAREIVITEGNEGGRYGMAPLDRWDRFSPVRASAVRCVVGAGDTFNGGYLVARLSDGASPEESCMRGAELAARKVSRRGSMLAASGQPASAS